MSIHEAASTGNVTNLLKVLRNSNMNLRDVVGCYSGVIMIGMCADAREHTASHRLRARADGMCARSTTLRM
jgi:hypothetical protein